MTKESITQWLESADSLPDASEVNAMLKAWPWFVPARHMQAALLHHKQPFSKEVLNNLSLYGSDWLATYRLLTLQERPAFRTWESEEAEQTTDIVQPAAGDEKASTTVIDEPAVVVAAATKEQEVKEPNIKEQEHTWEIEEDNTPLIQPLYTEDYFRHQGIATEAELPEPQPEEESDPRTLMVMMSFTEWLTHFKVKSAKEREEEREKSALRSMWQREKLAAALEEDPEEIPEEVFEMAVSSITKEDDLVSESLAEILEKQEKWDAAAEMYRKLGLRNPSKSAYFALRADAVKKKKL